MEDFEEIATSETVWRFEKDFLTSNWTCIWGRGCKGIGVTANTENGHGCCSVGAELDGEDEALNLSANAAFVPTSLFQFHEEAALGGVFRDEKRNATRVVEGACIFLNRPGFEGGAGCALHLAAQHFEESPIDWKPSVCWQLPIKVDWELGEGNTEIATVRRWSRKDWGDDGDPMAWCCTEGSEAYVGDQRVIDSLSGELTAIVGEAVMVQLRQRLR
jgi:hypothetical protein